ncbi:hypothetical protein [Empedobacter brevis]|uniref:tetratricopeptide repeat protein n=1 Tax=Empedobacter brevis TaxID=247 RepID=UPI0028D54D0D|nr:hypothetical protein [Empedobacter brevis]
MKTKLFYLFFILVIPVLSAQKVDSIRTAYDYVYFDPKKAIELADQIIKNSTDKNDQITARLIKTNAYSSLDDGYNSLKYAYETYDYVKKEKDTFNEARILGRLGELFQGYGFNTQSREYLDQSTKLILSKTFPEEKKAMYLGNIYGIKGNGYKDDLDCDFALKYYNKAIKAYQKSESNQSILNNLALVYIEKSNCLIDKHLLDSAKIYLNDAMEVIDKNKLEEYDQSAKISLARIYQYEKEYHNSNKLLNEVLKDIQSSQPLQVSNQIYKLLAQNSFELRDFESYKTYTGLVKETNVQLEETFLKAQEKSLNYLLHKDENFMMKLTKFWMPISLMFILLILVFRKMYVRHKKSMKV